MVTKALEMPKLSGRPGALVKVKLFLYLILFVAILSMQLYSLVASATVSNKATMAANDTLGRIQFLKHHDGAPAGTYQDFDLPSSGTPYVTGTHVPLPTMGPVVIDGGPTMAGKLMRLAFTSTVPTHNSIAFAHTDPGAFDLVVADFDFRLTPSRINNDRADGIGFALLNTSDYGITGSVAPIGPWYAAEEANFANSLGIGFDIYESPGPPPEINNNHISVHFNGELAQEFDARPVIDLGGGEWIHARIIMRPGGGYSDVTIILTPCGRPAATVVDQFQVPGFLPYEGRAYFAARSGGLSAEHDIDNIHVQFLDLSQSILAFNNGCHYVVETEGERLITVSRAGNIHHTTTISYTTADLTALAGSDYIATSGTLTFNSGEITKTFSVPVLNDGHHEGDESFLVSLSAGATGGLVGGPAGAKVTIIDDESSRLEGHWSEVIPIPVLPIHAHLLPNGKVMFWDRHDHGGGSDGNPRLWDPVTGLITATEMISYDLFCSGHSFLADGSLLVTGGHIANGEGEAKATIFDPLTNSWTPLPDMNAGRWYPSNVTLANGDVLVMAGTIVSETINPLPQVWQVAANSWRDLTTAQQGNYPIYADYYPFLYLAPDGTIFNAGPQQVARSLDTSGTGTWAAVATSTLAYRDYGSSVMYDNGKVLIVGGSPERDIFTPSASAEVIDLGDTQPAWRTVDTMEFARRHLNATLLPDGKTLVTGGSSAPGFDNASGAVLPAEIWDPVSEEWTTMAAQSRYRGYHSTALLLPDGRVLVGGGGHPDAAGGAQYNFEIYSPPYLFKGQQPIITSAPKKVFYGQTFLVETPDASGIQNINWIRLSSVTHAFNQNQRINHLSFTWVSDSLRVTAPTNANLAPPGHYMLFILNDDGVPSMAQIIQIVEPVAITYLPVVHR